MFIISVSLDIAKKNLNYLKTYQIKYIIRLFNMNTLNEWDKKLLTDVLDEDIENVSISLKNGANIEVQLYDQMTPLHFAVENGSLEMVKLLLEHGAEVNKSSYFGDSILMTATKRENKEILTILLQYRADVNVQDTMKRNVLHYAIMKRNSDICSILLENGVFVNQPDIFGETPIYAAVIRRMDLEIIQKMVEKGGIISNTDACGHTALHRLILMAYKEDNDTVKYIDNLLSIHKELATLPSAVVDRTPLHVVAFTGNLELLSVISAHTSEKDNSESLFSITPEELAVVFENNEVAKLLDIDLEDDESLLRESISD
ncbi:putative ankyrin repeat protein RF_0381 [Daktulosphaira vitifoliae]|uniref:putative ankyrin repeat protein RF_0381 n=1 Tax=Daktulosphaira vitifoliae TaxID=58002 RepID=UPI0021AA20CC|nr:putative ankyrin repeat protein RF_0381 [Daktulosphaira vitifoliae]